MNLTWTAFLPSLGPRSSIFLNLLPNSSALQITILSLKSSWTCSCINHSHYASLVYFSISTHLLSCWWSRGHSRMTSWCGNGWSIEWCYTYWCCSIENGITSCTWGLGMSFSHCKILIRAAAVVVIIVVEIWITEVYYLYKGIDC